MRSLGLVKQDKKTLDRHLTKATQALIALTPPPKQRVKQFTEEEKLQQAITAILQQQEVEGLLLVQYEYDETYHQHQETAGRYVITTVQVDRAAYQARLDWCGWRVYVTNAPVEVLSLEAGMLLYRQGAGQGIERMNKLLKDHETLGLDRLYVFHRLDRRHRVSRHLSLSPPDVSGIHRSQKFNGPAGDVAGLRARPAVQCQADGEDDLSPHLFSGGDLTRNY